MADLDVEASLGPPIVRVLSVSISIVPISSIGGPCSIDVLVILRQISH